MPKIALIVDDEDLIAKTIKRYLRNNFFLFHFVFSKNSADEVYDFLPEIKQYEGDLLLISDYNLGKNQRIKNGIELAQLAQKQYPGAKIIIMSGENKPQKECRRLGYYFIKKPFPLIALKAAIEEVMGIPNSVRDE